MKRIIEKIQNFEKDISKFDDQTTQMRFALKISKDLMIFTILNFILYLDDFEIDIK